MFTNIMLGRKRIHSEKKNYPLVSIVTNKHSVKTVFVNPYVFKCDKEYLETKNCTKSIYVDKEEEACISSSFVLFPSNMKLVKQ